MSGEEKNQSSSQEADANKPVTMGELAQILDRVSDKFNATLAKMDEIYTTKLNNTAMQLQETIKKSSSSGGDKGWLGELAKEVIKELREGRGGTGEIINEGVLKEKLATMMLEELDFGHSVIRAAKNALKSSKARDAIIGTLEEAEHAPGVSG